MGFKILSRECNEDNNVILTYYKTYPNYDSSENSNDGSGSRHNWITMLLAKGPFISSSFVNQSNLKFFLSLCNSFLWVYKTFLVCTFSVNKVIFIIICMTPFFSSWMLLQIKYMTAFLLLDFFLTSKGCDNSWQQQSINNKENLRKGIMHNSYLLTTSEQILCRMHIWYWLESKIMAKTSQRAFSFQILFFLRDAVDILAGWWVTTNWLIFQKWDQKLKTGS